MSDRDNARFLRIAVIHNLLESGYLDRSDAIEILQGCLTPRDETTRQDDSYMLDWTVEQVMKELGIKPTGGEE